MYQLMVTQKLYVPIPGLRHSQGSMDAAFAMRMMDMSANPQCQDAKVQLSKEGRTHLGQLGCRVIESQPGLG